MEISSQSLLAEYQFEKKSFEKIESIFSTFQESTFKALNTFQKLDIVSRTLVKLLKQHEKRGFLLREVLDYIHQVHEKKVLEKYTFSDFELWMNQLSGLTHEENAFYRALITGKWIPREDYQVFFPIGMGKTYSGSHFVTAHQSPDIDTIVSSFWGWMDAFSARVGSGLHVWNVPGGPPASSVEVKLLFAQILHPHIFDYLSKNRGTLALTSFDLMTQQGFVRMKRYERSLNLDTDRTQSAVVVVDDEGYYVGDWRPFDVESIRQVIMLLNLSLRWLESSVHLRLFSLFSKPTLLKEDVEQFTKDILGLSIKDSDPFKEMTLRQQALLDKFMIEVLSIHQGTKAQFKDVCEAADRLEIGDFSLFSTHLNQLVNSELFDKQGHLIENRPVIFHHVENIVKDLTELLKAFRNYIDTLDVGYQIKSKVYGHEPQFLSYRSEFKEIENQMGSYPYLTVNMHCTQDKLIPVGIIKATDLKKPFLGTVTLRDFSNTEETKVPSYLEVISVIDHHKTALSTSTAPTATIADAQSVNTILCQLSFSVHEEYSLYGMTKEAIENQIEVLLKKESKTSSDYRILRTLYKKMEVARKKHLYFVDPEREFLEYLHYLYAILDDTDLLTKVSKKDVLSVKDLLNRLKSLMTQSVVEVVNFDDIDQESGFVKKAANRLLKNRDLYSLYSVASKAKEKAISHNFVECSMGQTSDVFTDTKVQNGCCRVGQTKMFNLNYPVFQKLRKQIRDFWVESAKNHLTQNPEVDLHLHMISTIASSEELYEGKLSDYSHKDEMWIYIPFNDLSVEHLKLFLNAFKNSPAMIGSQVAVECHGLMAKEYAQLFKESFLKIEPSIINDEQEVSYAIIYYPPGVLNSRKAMVSPFLPKIHA